MNPRRQSRLCAAAALMVTSSLLFVSACSSEQIPPTETVPTESPVVPGSGKGKLPAPTLDDVRNVEPVDLLVTMCETVFTRDAATESSYSDSYRRAKALMAPSLKKLLLKDTRSVRPFPEWVQWQRDQAWVTGDCTVTTMEHPADTAASVGRVLQVRETVEPHGDPDASSTQQSWVVYATASKVDKTWLVSQFTVQPN